MKMSFSFFRYLILTSLLVSSNLPIGTKSFPTNPNEPQIDEICSNSAEGEENRTFCYQLFNKNLKPQASTEDFIGVTIDEASRNARETRPLLKQVFDSSTEIRQKNMLGACLDVYGKVESVFSDARSALDGRQYNKLRKSVQGVPKNLDRCKIDSSFHMSTLVKNVREMRVLSSMAIVSAKKLV